MGKLIIDGDSVFEIDEECVKKRQIPKDCDIEKYLKRSKNDIKKKRNYSAQDKTLAVLSVKM